MDRRALERAKPLLSAVSIEANHVATYLVTDPYFKLHTLLTLERGVFTLERALVRLSALWFARERFNSGWCTLISGLMHPLIWYMDPARLSAPKLHLSASVLACTSDLALLIHS